MDRSGKEHSSDADVRDNEREFSCIEPFSITADGRNQMRATVSFIRSYRWMLVRMASNWRMWAMFQERDPPQLEPLRR